VAQLVDTLISIHVVGLPDPYGLPYEPRMGFIVFVMKLFTEHKINTKKLWLPPMTSSLETEWVYSGRSRYKSGSKPVRKQISKKESIK